MVPQWLRLWSPGSRTLSHFCTGQDTSFLTAVSRVLRGLVTLFVHEVDAVEFQSQDFLLCKMTFGICCKSAHAVHCTSGCCSAYAAYVEMPKHS